jgi:hypothetical protein
VDEEKPVKEAELGDRVIRGAGRLETMPEIPTPTWAFWIMARTLAQSPMANVTACVLIFTASIYFLYFCTESLLFHMI